MKKLTARNTLVSFTVRALTLLLVTVFLALSVNAQSATDGTTPLGLSPGSPAGSYPLSDFETVNLFNGSLNFSLPLLQIGGRGGAGYPITLHLEQKWNVTRYFEPGTPAFYWPEPGWWSEEGGGWRTFDAGRLQIRLAGSKDFTQNCGGYLNTKAVSRVTFSAPDGTEYELRDQLTHGQPKAPVPCTSGFNRGRTFVTADGTSATFVSDSDIIDPYWHGDQEMVPPAYGYLMLRDGTRFRVQDDKIIWMRDRNGNTVEFTHDLYKRVTSIKDSLNRVVTVAYDNGYAAEISFKGVNEAPRTIRIGQAGLNSVLRSGYSPQTSSQLFPELHATGNWNNPMVLSYIELPDGRKYQLQYNSYGELARVVLPTGGAIEYDYAAGLTDGYASGVIPVTNNKHIYRRVIERRVYPDGGSGAAYASRMTYSRPETSTTNAGYVMTDQYNSSGTLLARSQHSFYGSARTSFLKLATDYPGWQDSREYQTDVFDTDGTTVLQRVNKTFAQRESVSWWTGASDAAPPNDARLIESVTTIEPGGANRVSKQTFGFDDSVPFNNQNNVKEYDFGAGTPGALLRETRTTFITASNYTGTDVHLRSLPTQVSVYDGGGVERARTTTEVDNYGGTYHASLVPRSGISGLCNTSTTDCPYTANFSDAGYEKRGNGTATTSYLLTNGAVTGSISNYAQYDVAGNVVKTIDARGYETTLAYSDTFGVPDGNARINTQPLELSAVGQSSYAFATSATNALGHTSYTQFDFNTGRPVDGEDANGIVSSGYSVNDLLDRPTKVIRGVNTSAQNQTIFTYDETLRTITTSSDLYANTDGVMVSQVRYDPMGRTTETRQYENATKYIAVQQQYDALGRSYKTSNPFRPVAPDSETAVWTTAGFDALGRGISMTTPDTAVVSTSYSGATVTITDQAGKKRKSVTDGLGRLKEVYEDPSALNYLTSYSYDVLDNLTTVTQGTQTRTFVYDSLKRLTSATNPESGTISYTYDSNSNLATKTDALGRVSTYTYDALNRNTSIVYTNDPSGTLPVTRVYDLASNGKGRLYQSQTTGTNGSLTTIDSYDALGRPVTQRQQFYISGALSQSYTTQRSYNRAGAVVSQTYPSGRTVSYVYDTAGRTSSFTGNLGDSVSRTYATGITYSPFGGIGTEQFGADTPLYHKLHYNNRGQLGDVRLSTVNDDQNWNRGAIINYYSWVNFTGGGTGSDTNGNLYAQQHWVPNDDAISGYSLMQQNYDYDALNRLNWVGEYANGATLTGSQTFAFGRYGNRNITGASGTGINNKLFTVNESNNRLEVPSGQSGTMTYNSAGNLTTDTYSGLALTRVYDAENRMVSETQASGLAGAYTYNADGQRVRRTVGTTTTWQVYGMDGELLAEYAVNGAVASPQKEYGYRNGELLVTTEPNPGNNTVQWLVGDQLGTPRIIADKTGSLAGIKRHDYLAFGEELYVGTGNRTLALGYSGDNVRQKFTSKERDIETGLDYFLARSYSSAQGRFTSPDEFTGGPDDLFEFAEAASANPTLYADLGNPQSLNKYQYTYNNPANMVDADGHCPTEPCADSTSITPVSLNPIGRAHQTAAAVVADAAIAVAKVGANLVIGASNIGNGALNGAQTQHYDSASSAQEIVMHAVEVFTLLSPVLGRAGPTAILSAESRPAVTVPYSRPSGATTPAQRASVQGQPCSVCGESAPRMNAGHKEALVKEYYRTGTIDRTRMRDIGAVRSECPTCSNREGARMSRYSKAMKNQIPR
ncbi:MAG: RHS repeat-associated core domain-containing protein [Acidobacteriota bacterium]